MSARRRLGTVLSMWVTAVLTASGCGAPPPETPRSLPAPSAAPASTVEPPRPSAITMAPGAASAAPATAHVTYVRAGHFFDGTGETLRDDVILVIAGERIQRVAAARELTVPPGADVIDLSRATVLPGLIDCHVHLGARADHYEDIYAFTDTPFDAAFNAVINAKKTLDAGFTTVRNLSSPPFLAVDLRRAIDSGYVPGPRVVASGPMVSMTGGHGDLNGFSPQTRVQMFPSEQDFRIADSVDQIRHVVRAQIKYGVDVIKLAASGGVTSHGDEPGAPQFTVEEMRAAVDEAHAQGRKVAAHAHGARAIKNATIAGVDSIEHGSFLDEEGIRLMKAHGTWLVADIYNDDYILGHAVELKIPEDYLVKERAVGRTQRENFRKAVKAGVKIAFGTDAGIYPHGDNGKQFALMVEWGMTPAAALRSATSDAATLIGRADVGVLTAGRFADFIAVSGNPLTDVRLLEHVPFVVKGGVVVKNDHLVP